MEYIDEVRQRILRDLDDLKNKIETKEPCPDEIDQDDIDLLIEIGDNIESCLSNWYY
jgi:hypothetical protein